MLHRIIQNTPAVNLPLSPKISVALILGKTLSILINTACNLSHNTSNFLFFQIVVTELVAVPNTIIIYNADNSINAGFIATVTQ